MSTRLIFTSEAEADVEAAFRWYHECRSLGLHQ